MLNKQVVGSNHPEGRDARVYATLAESGLQLHWQSISASKQQVHDLAKEKGIRTVVVSGSQNAEREAKKREVEFVHKGDFNKAKKLTDIFGNI